eukprot:GHVR01110988.1.p1 GENE.GHVR01110988.1~~GHVR01110988.1.p1  ORF type:complete len:166 (+),score=11.74 GHVR01110988.1:429-926(+)
MGVFPIGHRWCPYTRDSCYNGAGHQLRLALEKHHLTVANAATTVEYGYVSETGPNRIGYLCIHDGMANVIVCCHPLRRSGAKLQPMRGPAPRVHPPVMPTMAYNKEGIPRLPQPENVCWHRDRMMSSSRMGEGRWDFLEQVSKELRAALVLHIQDWASPDEVLEH